MCDPLTIAGIALTAGSTVANSMAANKAAKARSKVMEAERTRQRIFDEEAQALNTQSQDRYKTFGEDMGKRGEELGDYFEEAGTIPTDDIVGSPTDVMPASDSNITVQEGKSQEAAAKKYTGKQAKALGNLRSFGDYLGDVSRKQAREAGLVGQIGGFKQGSSSIVPYELDSANHAGDSLKMFGDLLNFGGGLAMSKGMQGTWDAVGGTTPKVTAGFPAAPAGGGFTPYGGAGPWGAQWMPIPRARPNIGLTVGDLYGDTGRR